MNEAAETESAEASKRNPLLQVSHVPLVLPLAAAAEYFGFKTRPFREKFNTGGFPKEAIRQVGRSLWVDCEMVASFVRSMPKGAFKLKTPVTKKRTEGVTA